MLADRSIFELIQRCAYKLNLIADYITEYGEDGIWKTEIWASGKKIAKGSTGSITTGTLSPTGSNYYKSLSIATLPADFFTVAEYVQITIEKANGVQWISGSSVNVGTGGITVAVLRSLSASGTVSFSIEIEGR